MRTAGSQPRLGSGGISRKSSLDCLMKAVLVSLTSVLLASASAGDWQSELTRKPGTFAPLRPLKATYDFGWAGFKAARAEVDFSRTASGQYQLDVKGAS